MSRDLFTSAGERRYLTEDELDRFSAGVATLSNSILWNNQSADLDGQEAQLYATRAEQITIDACCVQDLDGSPGGAGNIDRDPRFLIAPTTASAGGMLELDLRLAPGSACIDSGSDDAVASDETDLDADGDTLEPLPLDLAGRSRFSSRSPRRPGDGALPVVDIGAFEAPPLTLARCSAITLTRACQTVPTRSELLEMANVALML